MNRVPDIAALVRGDLSRPTAPESRLLPEFLQDVLARMPLWEMKQVERLSHKSPFVVKEMRRQRGEFVLAKARPDVGRPG